MRRYTMQDRSEPTIITKVDEDLNIIQVFLMTDYTEEQVNRIVDLTVGEEYLMDDWCYIRRDQ